jgi:polysaccharide pyruvyl transferase WcaK-like protein
MGRVIENARRQPLPLPPLGAGRKLKLLFAGYNGTRNTGSDVRVEEMLRQVRALFGAENVDLTVFSFVQSNTVGYFGDARQITPDTLFPPFLGREVPQHHGVIACEGSTFKSKFTDLLTVMMVGALGVGAAHGRLSIAYGAEAGYMNPLPKQLTKDHCRDSLIITRNEESRSTLAELGVPSEFGTDTAWTFEPHGEDYAHGQLRQAGWNGEPVLCVCPINPFWWPVKASLGKSVLRLFGLYKQSHYGKIFFFTSGREVEEKFERYLTALASAVDAFRQRTGAFVIAAASEGIDEVAMHRFAKKLGGAPTFSSANYNMHQLVSIFRSAEWMLSSRYHAIVTSMPGKVASAGVTMDERIANLMRDRGHERLLMTVDDPDLEAKALAALDYMYENKAEVTETAGKTVVKHLRIMSNMGKRLVEYVHDKLPAFDPPRRYDSWEDYLPPLGPAIHSLLEEHAHAE